MEVKQGEKAQFKVDHVTVLTENRPVIFAQQLNDVKFVAAPGSLLGDAQIELADIPRKLDEAGNQRYDYFGFWLRNHSDLGKFKVGEIVFLTEVV